MKAKKYTEIALLILFLSSCSPQQRLQRLLKKNPQLIELDTIRVIDTVIIDNYTYDTITRIHLHDSTTVINNEKVILKYFYDTLTRELSWWEQYGTIVIIISLIVGVLIVLKKLGKILI